MFKSLKSWLNIPVTIKTCTSRDGTGAKQFSGTHTEVCYAEGKVVVTKNGEGKEVVSNKQLYLNGSVDLSETDNIIFEGNETEISAIGYFYRNGVVDLKVVYL